MKRKRNTHSDQSQKFYENVPCPANQNINYEIISKDTLIFELQEIGWDLSMMRISYKLTKKEQKLKNLKRA